MPGADVDERQVLALEVSGDRPVFVTGDSAALYRVMPERATEAFWFGPAIPRPQSTSRALPDSILPA